MNPFLLAGLVVGILLLVAYVGTAAKKGKVPDLVAGIGTFTAGVAVVGAMRLVVFPFTEQFAKLVASPPAIWGLTPSDGITFVIGGLSLGWVGCHSIYRGFAPLWK